MYNKYYSCQYNSNPHLETSHSQPCVQHLVYTEVLFVGEESQRAASDRTMSEYTVTNERARVVPPPRKHRARSHERERRARSEERPHYTHPHTDHEGSDIYVTSAAYRAPSEIR